MEAPYVVALSDGVWINGRYYCRNLRGLQTVLTNLRTVGYVVENKRHTDRQRDVSVGEFEVAYRPMWVGELPGVNVLQCGSCLGIIGYPWSYNEGAEDSLGRPCEFCGVPTMVASGENYKGPDPFIPNCSEVLFWRGQVFPKPPARLRHPLPHQCRCVRGMALGTTREG